MTNLCMLIIKSLLKYLQAFPKKPSPLAILRYHVSNALGGCGGVVVGSGVG